MVSTLVLVGHPPHTLHLFRFDATIEKIVQKDGKVLSGRVFRKNGLKFRRRSRYGGLVLGNVRLCLW